MTRAYLALGSNLGDRRANLQIAIDALIPVARSPLYETDPVGGPAQGQYLNMVVEIDTDLWPDELLRECQRIEQQAGRIRTVRWGERTLDIDILLYDGIERSEPHLTIPHPRMFERRFVLQPLADIAPERVPDDWDEALPPGGLSRVRDL